DVHISHGHFHIEASLKISKISIQKILHDELGVKKLVSRWIPHLLTEQQKAARVSWCQKTLDRFNSGNSKNVYSIVRGDESWIYCYEPENKRQSAIWVFQGEEKPTKAGHIATIPLNEQRTHTAQKSRQFLTEENVELLDHPPDSPDLSPEEAVDAFKNAVFYLPANEWNKCFENWFERMQMCINLQHFRAIIYYNFQRQLSQQECLAELLSVFGNKAPHQSTISHWYGEFKLTQENVAAVRKLIIESRHVTLNEQRTYLTEENVELLDHPPHSSDLSPNDFFTFPKIKNRLRGQRFQSPEEAVDAFKNAVFDLPANEGNKCFENWFERMQLCIDLHGEYFEKQ
ncbi:unnamed protein product, partial [Acanthoscelides obtectus]